MEVNCMNNKPKRGNLLFFLALIIIVDIIFILLSRMN